MKGTVHLKVEILSLFTHTSYHSTTRNTTNNSGCEAQTTSQIYHKSGPYDCSIPGVIKAYDNRVFLLAQSSQYLQFLPFCCKRTRNLFFYFFIFIEIILFLFLFRFLKHLSI